MENKFLVFDIYSEYAHFKKPYTTTSPLTFSVPPVSAIIGLISAIIGLDKNEYTEFFTAQNCKMAIRIIRPIKKVRMGLNLIKTNKTFCKIDNRKPTKVEYLKDPEYRVFFHHDDSGIYNKFKNHLENHSCVYTVSLGLSENLANFNYVGEYIAKEQLVKDFCQISSMINLEYLGKGEIDFNEVGEYFTENIPFWMTKERLVKEYATVIYERNGKPIIAKPKSTFYIEEINENFCVL